VAAALTRHECADILMQARHLFVCLTVTSAYMYMFILYFGCQMMTRPTLDHQFSLVVEITNSSSGNKKQNHHKRLSDVYKVQWFFRPKLRGSGGRAGLKISSPDTVRSNDWKTQTNLCAEMKCLTALLQAYSVAR